MAVTVPPEVNWLLDLLCGQDWPQGDEDKLRAASQAWMDAMLGIAGLADGADLTSMRVHANADSTSGDAFKSFWDSYLKSDTGLATGDGGVFGELFSQCEQQAKALVDQANEVEYTKLIIVFTLILVAIQIIWAIAAAIMTMGGSLAEIGLAMFLGRESIMIALSRFLQMALTMLVPDLIAQTVMLAQGKGWDGSKTLTSGENALVGGLLGSFLGAGMSKLPWMGEDLAKTFGGKLVQGLSHFAEGGLVNDATTLATVGTQYAWADLHGDKDTMAALSQELSAGNLFHQFLQGGALATAFYLPHLALPHGTPLTFTDAEGNQYQVVLTDKTLAAFNADDSNLSGQKLTVFNDQGYGVGKVTLDGNTAKIDYTFGGSKTVDLSDRGFTVSGHDGSLTTYGFDDQGQSQVVSYVKPSDGSVTIPTGGHDVTVPEGSMVHYAADGTAFRADVVDGKEVTTWQADRPGQPLEVTGVTVHNAVPIATGVFGVRSSTVYGADGTSGDPVATTSWFSGHTSYGDAGVAGYHAAVGDHYSPLLPGANSGGGPSSTPDLTSANSPTSPAATGDLSTVPLTHGEHLDPALGQGDGTRSQNQDQPQVTVPLPIVIDPRLVTGHEGDPLAGQPQPPPISPVELGAPAADWSNALRFSDNGEAMTYAERAWQRAIDRLTPEQRDTLMAYTGEAILGSDLAPSYHTINRFLRGQIPATPEIEDAVARIDEALRLQPVPDNVVVYRRTNLQVFAGADGQPIADDANLADLVGSVQRSPQFLSTHFGSGRYLDAEVVLELTVPEGTPALYLGTVSVDPTQHELLLGRGLSYQVDRVWFDESWHVQAHVLLDPEVPRPWPDLFGNAQRGALDVPGALGDIADLVASRSEYDGARAAAEAAYRQDINALDARPLSRDQLAALDQARRTRTQAYEDQLKTQSDAFQIKDREVLQLQRDVVENQIKPFAEKIAQLDSEITNARQSGADQKTISDLIEQRKALGQSEERSALYARRTSIDNELNHLENRYGNQLDQIKADLAVELTRRQHLDLDRVYPADYAGAKSAGELAKLDADYQRMHNELDAGPGASGARKWVLAELDRLRDGSLTIDPDLDARRRVVDLIDRRIRDLRQEGGYETEVAELERIGSRMRAELAVGVGQDGVGQDGLPSQTHQVLVDTSTQTEAGTQIDAAVAEVQARVRAASGRTVAAGYKLLIAGADTKFELVRGQSADAEIDSRWIRTPSGGIVEYWQQHNDVPDSRLVGSFTDRSTDAESLLVDQVAAKLAVLREAQIEPQGVIVVGADRLMCPSCQARMYDLMGEYPGVQVVVATGEETVIFDPDMAEIRPASIFGPQHVASAEVVPLGEAAAVRLDEVAGPDPATIPPLDEPKLVDPQGQMLSAAFEPSLAAEEFSRLAGAMRLRAASTGRMQAIVLDDEGLPRWVEVGRTGMFYLTREGGSWPEPGQLPMSWQRVLVATEFHPVDPADVALQFPPEQADGRIIVPPAGDAYRLVQADAPGSSGATPPEPAPPEPGLPTEPGTSAEPSVFGLGRGDESLIWAAAAGEPARPSWYHGPRVEFYADRSDAGNEIALYALYDRKSHAFLKIGISDDPLTIRYRDGIRHEDHNEIDVFVIGKFGGRAFGDPRVLITAVERYLVERWGGPLNNEEWAARDLPTVPDPAWQAVRDLLDKPGSPGGWPSTPTEDRQLVADLTAMVKAHIGPAFADRVNEITAQLGGPMNASRRAALQADQQALTAAAGAPLADFFSDQPAKVNLYEHAFYDLSPAYRERLNGQQVWAEPGREQLVGAYFRYSEQAKVLDQIADRFLSGDPVALAQAKAAVAQIDGFSHDVLDAAEGRKPVPTGPDLHNQLLDVEKLKDDLLADARRPTGNRAQVDKIWKPATQGDDALPWLQRSEPYEAYLNWLRGRPGMEPIADLVSRLGAEQYGDWANAAKCVHAALAYEASRRAGELVPPTELPAQFVHGATSGRQLADLASVWGGDARFTELGADELVRARAALREIFKNFGDGARGIVAIGYGDGSGHVINVENLHGRIVFADALDGKLDASYRLKGMTVGTGRDRSVVPVDYVSFLRTDDRNPSPEGLAQFVHLPAGMSPDHLLRPDLTVPASAGPFTFTDPSMGRVMGEGGSNPPSEVVAVPHVTYAAGGVNEAGDVVLASAVAQSRPWVLEVGAHSDDSWLGPVTPHSFEATQEGAPPPNIFAYGDPEVTRSLTMFPQTMDAVVVHDPADVFGAVDEFGANLRPGGLLVLDGVPGGATQNVPPGYEVVHVSDRPDVHGALSGDAQERPALVRIVVRRAIGDAHVDLDDAGAGAAPGTVRRSPEEIARLVKLMTQDTSDPSLFPQPIEIENRWGITQENQRWFQYFVDKYGLAIDVRPSNPESVPLLELGGVPKPPAIKMKTINPLDVILGARDMIGAVGYFKPELPSQDSVPPEIWADLVKRYGQRDKEFINYSAKMAEMTRMREYRVVDGVIYPFTPFPKLDPVARYGTLTGGDFKIDTGLGKITVRKQIFSEGPMGQPVRPIVTTPVIDPTLGPPVTGDHDMFDVRLDDNQPLPYDKPEVPPGYPEPAVWFKKLINEEAIEMAQIRGKGPETGEMLAWQMGVQHGAIRVFLLHEQVPDWERESIYDPIIAGHMPGGQPLVRFQADRRPQLVNALTPVDQLRLPPGPSGPLLLPADPLPSASAEVPTAAPTGAVSSPRAHAAGPASVPAHAPPAQPVQSPQAGESVIGTEVSAIADILNPPEVDQPAAPNPIAQALAPSDPPITEESDT